MKRFPTLLSLFVLLAAPAVLSSCVEKTQQMSSADRERLRPFLSNSPPSPQVHLDAHFEDKLVLLGYDLSAPSVAPGQPVTVTWYWKVEKDLDDGWLLFTHVADAGGTNRLNQDGTGVVREVYPPSRWEAGQYIKDEQTFTLPDDWNSERATVFVGLWNGPFRLAITSGPNDGENRARGPSFDTPRPPGAQLVPPPGAQPVELPMLAAVRAAGAVRIDGRLDEAAWQAAAVSAPFGNTMTGAPEAPNAKVRLTWDETNLYVAAEVEDDFLKSTFTERDQNLWEQDAVELFVDPDGDERNYFELQVSPQGVVFDTRYDARRTPAAPGHVDWNSGLRAGVTRRGTSNDGEADGGYTVEASIPWTAFDGHARPQAGETWRVNFYVMDARQDGSQRAVAWSAPREGDFHVPARFGRVQFTDPAAAQAAAPTAQPTIALELPRPVLAQIQAQLRPQYAAGGAGAGAPSVAAAVQDLPRPGEQVIGLPQGATVRAVDPNQR